MADNTRNKVFADFLNKRLAQPPSKILNVACGDGKLNICLSKAFPFAEIVGIDPKPRGHRRDANLLKGRFPDRIKNIAQYDLFVGMHPDEATWDIVRIGCLHNITFAVVPCCLKHTPPSFPGGNIHNWVSHISQYSQNHGMITTNTLLPMRGANHIIFSQRRKSA